MIISYEEAKAADKRGEKVECRRTDRLYQDPMFIEPWVKFNWVDFVLTLTKNYQFRIAEPDPKPDPYAELKAAQAAGKVIQMECDETGWEDDPNPDWIFPPDTYRIKPEPAPLKIEAGNSDTERLDFLLDLIDRKGTNGISELPWTKISEDGKDSDFALDRAAIDAAMKKEPYDNWKHVPAWAQWQAMDNAGYWYFFEIKPDCDNEFGWLVDAAKGQGYLPSALTPTNHTGDWTNSLQQRPK